MIVALDKTDFGSFNVQHERLTSSHALYSRTNSLAIFEMSFIPKEGCLDELQNPFQEINNPILTVFYYVLKQFHLLKFLSFVLKCLTVKNGFR